MCSSLDGRFENRSINVDRNPVYPRAIDELRRSGETILAWYRKLIAQKFDGSKHRNYPVHRGQVEK